jgi:hypothetical protein
MMRKVYLVDHAWPATAGDLVLAEAAGATEVFCGIPDTLRALGIATFGYHEIAGPAAELPNEILLWRIRVILAEDGTLSAIDAAVAALDDEVPENRGIKQRWLGPVTPQNFVNDSPLVQSLIAAFSGPLGLTQEYIDSVRARAVALPE